MSASTPAGSGLSRRSRYEALVSQYEAAAEVIRTHADTDVQLQPQDQPIAEEEPEMPTRLQPRSPPASPRPIELGVDAAAGSQQLPLPQAPARSSRLSVGGVPSLTPLSPGLLLRRGSAAAAALLGGAAAAGGGGAPPCELECVQEPGSVDRARVSEAVGQAATGGVAARDADLEEGGGVGGMAVRQLSSDADGGGGGDGATISPFTADAAGVAAAPLMSKHRSDRHHRSDKKKAPLVSTHWLKIDYMGLDTIIRVDKHKLMHKLGVQARDLRLLDLTSVTPPAILGRDKAIIVNLWYMKAIITLDYCLVVAPDSILDEHERAAVAAFVGELKAKLQPVSSDHPKLRSYVGLAGGGAHPVTPGAGYGSLQLPFELKVLEVCLDMTSGRMEAYTKQLEGDALPTLDALPHQVNAPNLEKARRIKNRLVRLTRDVESVREILERFLNDDGDMHRLHLTGAEMSRQVSMRPADLGRLSAGLLPMGSMNPDDSDSSSDSSIDEAETAAVEMLLEAYFMQVDHTYNRLQTVHEYIKDTEDLVTIKLDQHRNQLITIDLMLTSLTTVLNVMTVVAGYFGMNLNSDLQERPELFDAVVLTTTLGSLLAFVLFLAFLHHQKLLYF